MHKQSHTCEKPYSCELCKMSFNKRSNLTIHETIHTESPTDITCNICQKTYQEKIFSVHQRLHFQDKVHLCNLCGKVFITRDNLNEHDKVHTGEKAFSCDICKLKCKHLSHLKIHKRTHMGETPYSCEICKIYFSDSSTLREHKTSLAHLNRKTSLNTNLISNKDNYVNCGEAIKVEDIKEELNETESVEDPLSLQQDNQTNHEEETSCDYVDCSEAIKVEYIKEELNEVESVEDPLSVQQDNQTNHEEENPCDYDYDKIDIDEMKLEVLEKK